MTKYMIKNQEVSMEEFYAVQEPDRKAERKLRKTEDSRQKTVDSEDQEPEDGDQTTGIKD